MPLESPDTDWQLLDNKTLKIMRDLSQCASVDAVILSSGFLRAPGPRLRRLGTLPTANFAWETVQQEVLWNITELDSTFSKINK